ncbi:HAMP domain-containing protein [Ruegeria sp. HKCCD4884]|uniref:adenylate/guanylate cyclase domain-containing protein n=1 Tax=Ruegeria sp. HKCCD4884 TaxID=2683022 RepID=UPI001492B3B1|nr:adenylate/guanylate cyclase domain-containing protein [Ruegeria sp. HKCCD4884]NOD95086.1 HAMP domain-containing protein [Ruegeria sp. HKCCD4884]
MRVTIGFKIFAVAGAVILVMSTAAFWTTWKIHTVTDQVDAVADYFLPLDKKLLDVQANLLRQEIVLQSILNDIEDNAELGVIEEHLAAFNNLGVAADLDIEEATEIANAALDHLDRDQAIELGQLTTRIQEISFEHHQIQDLVLRALGAYKEGRLEAAAELVESFTNAQVRFDEKVDSVASEILELSTVAAQKADEAEHIVLRFSVILTVLALVLGLLFAFQLTKSLVRPVRLLRDRTKAVEVGDLSQDIPVTSTDEIADLSRSFNNMLEGLRSKERMQSMFGQYVDPRVVKAMLDEGGAETSLVTGDRKVVTVFFSDIAGFTQMGERLSPVGLVRLMNEYFTLASKPIAERDGVIDKYIGDMIMAFWSPPFVAEGNQARLACEAAIQQLAQLEVLRGQLQDITGLRKGIPEVDIRIGLATGEAVVGSIGSEYAKNFTVMGDTVNLGARLETANKVYGTKILICEHTKASAEKAIEVREIDSINVKGKTEPLRVFELLGLAGGLSKTDAEARAAFETGLAAYRGQDWDLAEEAFKACLDVKADDQPSKLFLRRVSRLRSSPQHAEWDSVWNLSEK